MEALRDTQYNLHLFGLRVNMLLAILMAVVAIALIIAIRIRKPARWMREPRSLQLEQEPAYEPQFEYLTDSETEEKEGEE